MRKRLLSAGMLLGGAVLLAVSAVAPASNVATRGGTLRWSHVADVDSLDPALGYDAVTWTIEGATCARLFTYPDESGAAGTRVIPEVVSRFTVSRDGTVYTFDLKKTYRFHTGATVTARNFAAALNRDASPRMQSAATNYLREVVGVDDVIAGKARSISGVRVLGPYRLEIRLTRPVGDFTARLTMPFFCPVPENTPVDQAGINDPLGSGPYYVADHVVNRQVVLRRNRFYRGSRPANVDEIVFTVMTGEACRVAVERDEMDYCRLIPPGAYREVAAKYGINRPGGQFFVSPALATWFFVFNHDRPAFKGTGQIPLKKAINHALDRPALARGFGYLGVTRTDQIIPPALGRDSHVYSLKGADVVTARKWLSRARLKPEKLVLYAWTIPPAIAAAQVFAFDLKQIGIDVEVKYFSPSVASEKAATRGEPFDVLFTGWGVDYADPAGYFVGLLDRNLRAENNSNTTYFVNPALSARLDAANRLTGDARRDAFAALDGDLMRTNPPWAPFAHITNRHFVSRSLGCVIVHPVYGQINLAAACKKDV